MDSMDTAAESRRSLSWLLVARCTWLLIAAGLLVNVVSGVPVYYAEQ